MYAKELVHWLNRSLWLRESEADCDKRLEALRGYGQLPRGRENAGVRLSDLQIANVVMGFATTPGMAGHVALILGGLRPVGGTDASFQKAPTLQSAIAEILSSADACATVVSLLFNAEPHHSGDEYRATLVVDENGERRWIHFVPQLAYRLQQPGADLSYDGERLGSECAKKFVIGPTLFEALRRDVEISRHWDKPLKTDWSEYASEEARNAFHAKLGARPNSTFFNVHVDTAVSWPMEPTRVRFAGHHLVLFPPTGTNTTSISIDLTHEKLSMDDATTLLNRFLSLLSWCDRQHAVLGFGWSGNPVPVPVKKNTGFSSVTQHWIFDREVPADDDVLQRLAYYREGHNARNAGLVTFEVLSFFKVFESRATTPRGHLNPTKSWILSVFEAVKADLGDETAKQFEADRGDKPVDDYVFENCRVATAHTSANFPSDADSSLEIRRLHVAAEIVHALARHYLATKHALSESRFG